MDQISYRLDKPQHQAQPLVVVQNNQKTAATYPSADPRERYADSAIHVVSLVFAIVFCTWMMVGVAHELEVKLMVACAIYCLGVMFSFTTSAGYHLLPFHQWRRLLRRLDHIAIYVLIAGTFTPLLVHIGTSWSYGVLAAVWIFAFPAMAYKLFGSVIEPRWSLASYLGLGWMGLLALPDFNAHLSSTAVIAALAGGLTYTFGTYFYAKEVQKYRYAIWHSFVFVGTAFFFFSVWITIFAQPNV